MPRRLHGDVRAMIGGALVGAMVFGCAQSKPPTSANARVDMNPDGADTKNAWAQTKTRPFEPVEPKKTHPFGDDESAAACTESSSENEATEFLFVQNAEVASINGETLTLHHVSPNTAYFSDRPKRVAGSVTTAEWVKRWGSGPDSFANDPPNANLACQDGARTVNAVVELESPQLSGDDLSYRILALDGTLPSSCESARLFIDGASCLWCF